MTTRNTQTPARRARNRSQPRVAHAGHCGRHQNNHCHCHSVDAPSTSTRPNAFCTTARRGAACERRGLQSIEKPARHVPGPIPPANRSRRRPRAEAPPERRSLIDRRRRQPLARSNQNVRAAAAPPQTGSTRSPRPRQTAAPPARKNGTSLPNSAATDDNRCLDQFSPHNRFAPTSAAAASLEPPPRPDADGIRLISSTRRPDRHTTALTQQRPPRDTQDSAPARGRSPQLTPTTRPSMPNDTASRFARSSLDPESQSVEQTDWRHERFDLMVAVVPSAQAPLERGSTWPASRFRSASCVEAHTCLTCTNSLHSGVPSQAWKCACA